MKRIITSVASLFVASTLSRKVKSSTKQGTILLIALGVLLGGITAASSISAKKWQASATRAATKNPLSANETSIAAGKNFIQTIAPRAMDLPATAMVGLLPNSIFSPQGLSESRGESDGALFWKITNGKKPMPGYGTRLSEPDR
jgi:hypothetical protein